MLNVQIERVNGILVTTSNRVADELGVLHKDLLEKIDNYLSRFNSAELSAQFYIPSIYRAKNGRKVKNYLITKKGIAQLIGGYSAAVERAFELNVAYINKFEEMEKALYSNKQLPIEYPTKQNLCIHTFGGIPVMEIKSLSQITGLSLYQITTRVKVIGVPILIRENLKKYKTENKEVENNIPKLIILFKEHVINICKYFGIYENVKDIIENYFKIDNKIEHKEEPKQEKSKHTLEELELVLKASEHLNEKLQRHCVAEHVIEEIMGVKFFDSYYTSKTAIIAKAEIEQMTPAERKMLKKKIETNKMYGLLEPKAKGIVDCVLGKE